MQQLIDLINANAIIPDHYLVIAQNRSNTYYSEFLEAGQIMANLLNEKEFALWTNEKMLLRGKIFQEKTFIQYAIETAVVRFFGERFPKDFKVEAKINPNNDKDVDCQFVDGEFTYNVEVKCSDFVAKEKIDKQDAFKYGTIGRLPDRGEKAIETLKTALDQGSKIKGELPKAHVGLRNMDNNLKDFLLLAHEKFNPTSSEKEVNILIVGCDDAHDVQNWVNYLYAEQGLFTQQSFADRRTYQNVDLVILTNQYYKQNRFYNKNVSGCWTLENSFNIIMVNPARRLKKTEAIQHFTILIPHYGNELGNYVVPGNAPDFVKESVIISNFVKEYLEEQNGIYLFDENRGE